MSLEQQDSWMPRAPGGRNGGEGYLVRGVDYKSAGLRDRSSGHWKRVTPSGGSPVGKKPRVSLEDNG